MSDQILDPSNIGYLEELYSQWNHDPSSISEEWQALFSRLEKGGTPVFEAIQALPPPAPDSAPPVMKSDDMVRKQSRVDSLMWAYRDVGYLYAKLNPLVGYLNPDLHYLYKQKAGIYEKLTIGDFGLEEEDLDTVFSAGRDMRPGLLREILRALDQTYCSSVGVEFLHIQDKPIRRWLITQMEATLNRSQLDTDHRRIIMEDLIKAEVFEHFLHSRFIGQKRFSLEGAEVLVPALHFLVDAAIYRGGEEIVLGMSHRGRLNVLAHILNKPAVEIFSEFEAVESPDQYGGSDDVKYHLGYQRNHVNENGKFVTVTLTPNPSHLESIDPVVEGLSRGAQKRRKDRGRKRVIPVLIHGDAAFSGQGIVAETFNLSQTRGYRSGGTIHIIVNNQIGFTTSTTDARSTFFPTDIAKIVPVPIFHVNGDDPDAVIHVINLALNFRQEFGRDVVVDIFCYRRHGHNEGDEPSFTHPRMYRTIRDRSSVTSLYGDQLAQDSVVTAEDQNSMRESYVTSLREALKQESGRKDLEQGEGPSKRQPGTNISAIMKWQNERNRFSFEPVDPSVSIKILNSIGKSISSIPENFHIHAKLKRIIETRHRGISEGGPIDFSTAESLAFGSLLLEGVPIRLSGEDSGRGTFSQRHAVWWDTETDEPSPHVPLNALAEDQARFSVYDSPLSEYSIMGFEYGYSLAVPDELVMWEAQFGDFSNGAQVLIDNYLVSGEAKWNSTSRLVLLLPHGYEGMGPEHSSAHLERYLLLCAEDNIQVCNLTTPAQYFHLLRRQVRQHASKPLVLMTPKSLLRHRDAVSSMAELAKGSFQCIIDDPEPGMKPSDIKTLCFCSGKLYYELTRRRSEIGAKDTAIVRIEQLYPFPAEQMRTILNTYAEASRLCWAQEESGNRGAWLFIREQVEQHLGIRDIEYIGREKSASPATGSHKRHLQEQRAILTALFNRTAAADRPVKKLAKRNVATKQ